MSKVLKYIQIHYGYSDYEIAQVKYFLTVLSTEISKFIILALFWWHKGALLSFIWAMCIFALLRSCSGGIHLKYYFSCFIASFIHFILCVDILPKHHISKLQMGISLFLWVYLIIRYTPTVSKYRHTPTLDQTNICRKKISIYLIIFIIAIYCIPNLQTSYVIYWSISLHALQLSLSQITGRRTAPSWVFWAGFTFMKKSWLKLIAEITWIRDAISIPTKSVER